MGISGPILLSHDAIMNIGGKTIYALLWNCGKYFVQGDGSFNPSGRAEGSNLEKLFERYIFEGKINFLKIFFIIILFKTLFS